jgi:hypothetical protein
MISGNIQDGRDEKESAKYGETLQPKTGGELFAIASGTENAKYDLTAVVYHGLDVDTNDADKDIPRIEHHRQAAKEGKEGGEGDGHIAKSSILEEGDQGIYIERGGAELEGEGVPLKIPNPLSITEGNRINELLVYLGDEKA